MEDKYIGTLNDPAKPVTKEEFDELNNDSVFVECPCCGIRHNQVYMRRIYKTIARALKFFSTGRRDVTASSIGDFTKLRHWGLIDHDDQSPFWKITEKGYSFLNNEISIPKVVFIQNNEVVGFGDEKVFFHEIVD